MALPADSVRTNTSYVGYSDLDRRHPWTKGMYKRARQMFDPVGLGYPPSWIETLGFFIRTDNPAPLEAGMIFHLPMSLRVAGRLGICLSQTMLVTPDGGVPLTSTPARLAEIEG